MILLVPSMWGIPSGGSVTRSGIWRTARHSAKWPTHNSWMSTRFFNQFLEMWDPQALLVNGVSTNHRTAFAGKIFTGNHVFFPWRSWSFPVVVMATIATSQPHLGRRFTGNPRGCPGRPARGSALLATKHGNGTLSIKPINGGLGKIIYRRLSEQDNAELRD